MKIILVNIVLAHVIAHYLLEWAAWPYTLFNFTVLLGGSVVLLWLFTALYNRDSFRKFPVLISFLLYFIKEMFRANIRVAIEAITPVHYMNPAIIALPLDAETDLEITILANLISLTPGTLTIDVSPDKKTLFVHIVYTDQGTDAVKKQLKDGFEKKILKLSR